MQNGSEIPSEFKPPYLPLKNISSHLAILQMMGSQIIGWMTRQTIKSRSLSAIDHFLHKAQTDYYPIFYLPNNRRLRLNICLFFSLPRQ